ncbi:MAG: kinase/pyrophosphorylase [Gammaproteobacteria bacterium]|jgi:hypothetical protein|nr:kinase/pyrophosphorylase [Candidatus Thioaporhodococcus sediminis]TNF52610.1 MAG: kinase/pyrophosphorylase [Gammaproteobacteria bacterium]
MKRTVFFVSESTGITAEAMGHSLLSQFEGVDFERVYMPFINTELRARALLDVIQEAAERDGARPIIFSTMLDDQVREIIQSGSGYFLELFEIFMEPLSRELGIPPSRKSGRSHAITEPNTYIKRIDAINFAMSNDDGVRPDNFYRADVVLLGVSRSGKTPTCIYLAMHYGLMAANYPITEEDFEKDDLPKQIYDVKDKVYGLMIDAHRLHLIRSERRAGSEYATLKRCQDDVRRARIMFQRLGIRVLDTTSQSIEEIASHILKAVKLKQRRAVGH